MNVLLGFSHMYCIFIRTIRVYIFISFLRIRLLEIKTFAVDSEIS